MPLLSRMVATATPTKRPWASTTGPPLLPGFKAASICTNGQIAVIVHPQAGDGTFAHGNRRAALARCQDLAEGKAEGVDRHRFRQLGFMEIIDRLGQLLDAADLDDGEVLFGIGRQDLAAHRFLLLRAALEDDGDGGILERSHQESRRVTGRMSAEKACGRVRRAGSAGRSGDTPWSDGAGWACGQEP